MWRLAFSLGLNRAADTPHPSGRNVRIDFFRGLALAVVLVDHIEWLNGLNYLSAWTPQSFGFSDAAEAFVFLSGCSLGQSIERRMQNDSPWRLLGYTISRSVRIYAAYLATLITVLILGTMLVPLADSYSQQLHLQSPWSTQILGALALANHPYGFAVLSFYVLVLPFGLGIGLSINRGRMVPVVVSFGLYLAAQWSPQFNLPATFQEQWFFNPFAWQFLVVLGILLPKLYPRINAPISLMLTILSLAMVIFAALHDVDPTWSNRAPWLNKTSLGPVRLIHFLSVAWLASITFNGDGWLRHGSVQWLVRIGQRSLSFYTVSLISSFVSIALLGFFGHSLLAVMLTHVDLFLATYVVSLVLKNATTSGGSL